MSQEFSRHGVIVDVELASDLPQVSIDVGQVRQSILNLVRNAIESMLSGGTLRIVTTC